jgi:hypothetical protein
MAILLILSMPSPARYSLMLVNLVVAVVAQLTRQRQHENSIFKETEGHGRMQNRPFFRKEVGWPVTVARSSNWGPW